MLFPTLRAKGTLNSEPRFSNPLRDAICPTRERENGLCRGFFCQDQRIMWPHMAQVKRVFSVRGHEHSQKSDHYLPSLHHLFKIGFQPTFDSAVLISLSSLDLCFHSSLVIVIVKSILVFDMVAEQCPIPGQLNLATSFCPSCQVTTTTVTTNQITSSSGEEERSHWSSRLQEELDIKMFSNDPRLNPRLPSPTTFDGVKPSYVEWSEEILTFLSVTDYQEFVPVLQAVIGHNDVITKKVFMEGVLSEIIEEIKKLNLRPYHQGLGS